MATSASRSPASRLPSLDDFTELGNLRNVLQGAREHVLHLEAAAYRELERLGVARVKTEEGSADDTPTRTIADPPQIPAPPASATNEPKPAAKEYQ